MKIEKLNAQNLHEFNAGQDLDGINNCGLGCILAIGKDGQKLTTLTPASDLNTGWFLRGGHDLHTLGAEEFEDIAQAPQVGVTEINAGITLRRVNWQGHETLVFSVTHKSSGKPVGFILYPPGIFGDCFDTHDSHIAHA